MGWWPRSERSTIVSRRWTRPRSPRSNFPLPSGPRWRRMRPIRSSKAGSAGLPARFQTPAMPHISSSLVGKGPGELAAVAVAGREDLPQGPDEEQVGVAAVLVGPEVPVQPVPQPPERALQRRDDLGGLAHGAEGHGGRLEAGQPGANPPQ